MIANPSLNILGLKDVVIFLVMGLYILTLKNTNLKPFLSLYPVAVVLFFAAVFSPAPTFAIVASLRQLIVPLILIFSSYLAIRSEKDLFSLFKKIRFNLWILLLFGFSEKIFGFWRYIDLSNFFKAKNIPLSPDKIPYVFIEPIAGGINRMVSLLLDPINLGHTLICLLCLELVFSDKYQKIRIILVIAGLALTFCKGAILQLFLIFIILNKDLDVAIRLLITAGLILFVVMFSDVHGGILTHFNGFIAAFDNISAFGGGLGTAGNQSLMFAGKLKGIGEDGIGDSFIGAIIGQIGVIGLLFWLIPFFIFSKHFSSNDIFKRILVSQLLIAILSENSFNLLSIYTICLIIGAKLSIAIKNSNYAQQKRYDIRSRWSKSRHGLLQQ